MTQKRTSAPPRDIYPRWKEPCLNGLIGCALGVFSYPPIGLLATGIILGLAGGILTAHFCGQSKPYCGSMTKWGSLSALLAVILLGPPLAVMGILAIAFLHKAAHLSGKLLHQRLSALPKTRQDSQQDSSMLRDIFSLGVPVCEREASEIRQTYFSKFPSSLREDLTQAFTPVTIAKVGAPSESVDPVSSRFGGKASLPPNAKWPLYRNQPLQFLAQLNLAELQDALPDGAPHVGLLSFFYASEEPWGHSLDDTGGAVILYTSDPSACVTRDAPNSVQVHKFQPIEFLRRVARATTEESENRIISYIRSLPPYERKLIELLEERVWDLEPTEGRVFSPPSHLEPLMARTLNEVATNYGLPKETEWTLVLQIESVREQNWCWGDGGGLFFWVPSKDLRVCRFDRGWALIDSP